MKKEIVELEQDFDFGGFLGIDLNEKKKNDFLDLYRSRKKNNETFEQDFNIVDEGGNLSYHKYDYEIRMNVKDVDRREYNPHFRANRVGTYPVVVTEIDEERKIIFVSHQKAKSTEKSRLIGKLNEIINDGKSIEVPAVVTKVYNNLVIIDIAKMGIPGMIRISDWSVTYTNSLLERVNVGDIVSVAVLNHKINQAERNKYFPKLQFTPFLCSRKDIMEKRHIDPWLNIEERVKEGSIVNVRCDVKEDSKFFGTIDGIDEINVYCYYPEEKSSLKKIDIIPGETYQCYVKKVNEEDRILRVRPFKWIKSAEKSKDEEVGA